MAVAAVVSPKRDVGVAPSVVPKPAAPEPEALPKPEAPTSATALPEGVLSVVVSPEAVEVGGVSLPVRGGSLPSASRAALAEAVAASRVGVAVRAQPDVPATVVARVVAEIGAEQPRWLVVDAPVRLANHVPPDAPELHIGADGFRVSERRGERSFAIKPADAQGVFDLVGLERRARLFRSQHPETTGARVLVGKGVDAGTLAASVSALRGRDCDGGDTCWFSDVALGRSRRGNAGAKGGSKSTPGSVKIGKLSVADTLDADNVGTVLRRRIGYARMCYFAALADDASLAGDVALTLSVAEDGTVEKVVSPSSTLSDRSVHACLARGLGNLRFSDPTATPATVELTLTFGPK